jgi:transposase
MYKSKYSPSFKMKLATLYLEKMSSEEVAKRFDVSARQIRYWGQVFELHGAKSFINTEPNPSATDKLSILQEMWTNNWSIGHTSALFNLSSPGILFKWQADYYANGLAGLKLRRKGIAMKNPQIDISVKPAEQMSDKELREELEYLRTENAVLKKLEALAQQKRVLAKKKR